MDTMIVQRADLKPRRLQARGRPQPPQPRQGAQNVLVIGAGIGGIATAARLARAGHRVTVLEKASGPGGRVHQVTRDGFTFDTGATMFLMPGLFRQTFAELGERMEDHLELLRVDPSCRIRFDDGSRLDLTGDLARLQEQLEAFEPGSFAQALRYLAEGAQTMRAGLTEFIGRDFRSPLDYFSPKNLPLFFKVKAHRKHYRNVTSYFDDERLRRAFSFQNMYLGLSPFDAPATYSVLQFTEMADGVFFPRGGMLAVIQALVEIGRRMGVRYLYNAPVCSINITGKRATGVTLENGLKLKADLVVANADLPYVYDQLLPDPRPAARLKKLQYTCSELIFLWGVDRTYEQLLQHNIFMPGDYRQSFDRIFKDLTLPDDPSFYVNVPARGDPRMAPSGQDGILAMVPVGHLDEQRPQDWDLLRDRARQMVFSRLSQIGMADLPQHLRFEETFGPPQFQAHLNLMKGAAFGLGYSFNQIGYLRPHSQHRRYRNLYFVGASTHPGGGLPIVLVSARMVSDRIQRDLARAQQPALHKAHAATG
jgi:phytoene desaturase